MVQVVIWTGEDVTALLDYPLALPQVPVACSVSVIGPFCTNSRAAVGRLDILVER